MKHMTKTTNRTVMQSACAAAVAAAMMWGTPVHADYVTDFGDFENGTLHDQDGWVVNSGAGSGTTTVVETEELFPSPGSMKYVKMAGGSNSGSGAQVMTASKTFADAPTTSEVAFEFVWAYRTPRDTTDNMFRAYLTSSTNSSNGAMLFFRDLGNGTASIIYPSSDVSSNLHIGDVIATVNPDKFYRIRVEFQGGDSLGKGHLSQMVNVAVYDENNALVGQVQDKTFYQNVSGDPGVNMIRFYDAGWGSQVFYIDEVSVDVIPEPATMGLLLTAGLLTMARRGR